ncbi:hypothetical protein L2E82_13349 [Cichorium intybus]|uniref:Uncharacterized protein n=1 Tax=Cichorium intybus TaxID=13427 RepID=A0ACB9EXW3_CICIN|nr:hypothetical protein L2E82_13349 [Cichorium intybus]
MKLHVHLTALPPLPRAAAVKSHSSRFTALRSQIAIPAIVAIAVVWDSLILHEVGVRLLELTILIYLISPDQLQAWIG